MGRRTKPVKAKIEGKPARKSPKAEDALIGDLKARLADSLRGQAATAEILRLISTSPADTQPVFESIARGGVTVLGALSCAVFVIEGDSLRVAATHGVPRERLERFRTQFPAPLSTQPEFVRTVREGIFHLVDIEHNPKATPEDVQNAQLGGYRTRLMLPMRRGDRVLGIVAVTRIAPTPFSDEQVALLQTFADQAVIAIENVRLFEELESKNRDLAETLQQQTATGEILSVIASSPTDIQPVFAAVAASANRLCDALDATIFQIDGELLRVAVHNGPIASHPVGDGPSLTRDTPSGRAVLDRRTIHVADTQAEIDEFPEGSRHALRLGFRTVLAVPLMREGAAIGVINLRRTEARLFTDQQVVLLKTFADQAVIAIENVRLFNETKEALERQTATSEILRVISSSPTDVQPVFDAIATSAMRLCGGDFASVFRVEGGQLVPLQTPMTPEHANFLRRNYPRPIDTTSLVGRSVIERRVVHVPDLADPSAPPGVPRETSGLIRRSQLTVPLLRDCEPVGVIAVSRRRPGAFSEKQIELLKTFADQAVIAIENVRLFTELQEKNRALTQAHAQVSEALDQQTATSEILRTIAQAQTDVQPVFDTIVRSAAQLCRAAGAAVFLTDGRTLYHPANYGGAPEALAAIRARYPRPLDMGGTPGVAILTRSIVHVPDIEVPSAPEFVREAGRVIGFRSVVSVPMLREGLAVGAINVVRWEPGRFSDVEVALLKTFADQAVIAIENVRLFKELEARTAALTRSVEQLTALGEVGRAVSSTLDLETVLTTIVSRAVQLSGLDGGVVFEYDAAVQEFSQRAAIDPTGVLAEARRTARIGKGEGVVGRTAVALEPAQVPDITLAGAYEGRLRETLIESGVRAILAVPMIYEGRLIGCLGVTRNQPGDFPAETVELLRTFATQSALAIQNARLFEEIADKSRQLEAASQHKSEFLANMSHELRTPLNAILGFSEVLAQGMFGAVNEKQTEYLRDILESGRHLLSLINDILDLSKIEAGRMELELSEFDLPQAIQNALTLVRERALRRRIALRHVIDPRLASIRADERKVKQVLLNLFSNAIKFTPEGGRIEVRAAPADGRVEVAVTDTGIGIASEDLEAVFEEFRQVGTADKKAEGTGLGLALAKKFVELHGGRIWVASEPGRGSTFTFTLPMS